MNNFNESPLRKARYDIIHFEALGPEANHLKEEILKAQQRKELPEEYRYLITPSSVQAFLKENPEISLPEIITTKTHSILPEMYLEGNKKSIITRSAGYDHLEYLAERANITSLREYCVNAVAQTAMKFLYATAGELNQYTKNTATFDRNNSNAFMELDKHKILTVYGVGKIGKRIYELAEANGLTVQGVDIRQEELSDSYAGRVSFISKEKAIETSDIIVNAMNLTRNPESKFYNVGYFSKEYLSKARRGILFINITRGEIAPESGLLELYQTEKIKGIGVDVFTGESEFAKLLTDDAEAGQDHSAAKIMVRKSIDRTANIYVQPHQGFNSDVAAQTKAVEAIKHVLSWYKNGKRCFSEQLPYY